MVREIDPTEREAILDLAIEKISVPVQHAMKEAVTLHALLQDPIRNQVSVRISNLVHNRVDASGSVQCRTAPLRDAPADLLLRVGEMLGEEPLLCKLCGGVLPLMPDNKLLQPSPDRSDSRSGTYGPENFQLSHLACNLAKNNATEEQFQEWLRTASEGLLDSRGSAE